jgi:hypothetical protein
MEFEPYLPIEPDFTVSPNLSTMFCAIVLEEVG